MLTTIKLFANLSDESGHSTAMRTTSSAEALHRSRMGDAGPLKRSETARRIVYACWQTNLGQASTNSEHQYENREWREGGTYLRIPSSSSTRARPSARTG